MSDLMGKVRRAFVPRSFVLESLEVGEHSFTVKEGLPKRSQVVHFEHDKNRDGFLLFVYCSDFPELEETSALEFLAPEIPIVIEAG